MTAAKKVRLKLVGLNGNAFNLMGAFQAAARDQGWADAEIRAVLDEAMSADYSHLLRTLMRHTEYPAGGGGDAQKD